MHFLSKIDSSSISKICAGQVITDLKSVLKELVENSIDSGATIINIKLSNHGLDYVEVSDNGQGIAEQDLKILGRSHCTSKIINFTDINNCSTLGFRGEAIHSLFIAADVCITTKACNKQAFAWKLECVSGKTNIQKASRSQGTTVVVNNLFKLLPVRRRELLKNIKREFQKSLSMLQAYTVINENISFVVSNQSSKSRNILLHTKPNSTLKQRISTVFGSCLLKGLQTFEFELQKFDSLLENYKLYGCSSINSNKNSFNLQILFVNKRPVNLVKISKVLVMLFKRYSMQGALFLVMNLQIPAGKYDLNLSPDKKTILLHNESAILNAIQKGFSKIFDSVLVSVNQTINLDTVNSSIDSAALNQTQMQESVIDQIPSLDSQPQSIRIQTSSLGHQSQNLESQSSILEPQSDNIKVKNEPISEIETVSSHEVQEAINLTRIQKRGYNAESPSIQTVPIYKASRTFDSRNQIRYSRDHNFTDKTSLENKLDFILDSKRQHDLLGINVKVALDMREIKIKSDFLKTRYKKIPPTPSKYIGKTVQQLDSPGAIDSLTMTITKDMFFEMNVVGQFNMGFILVTASKGANLLIIDQHASDEKYNYEQLICNTVLQTQKLVKPRRLDLTIPMEITAIENIKLLQKNGYVISIDNNMNPGKKLSLLSQPNIKNVILDHHDLEEFLTKIQDEESTQQISKINKILAGKACRMSVMIGKPLTLAQMTKIVRNLGTLSKPWNCPHGRPTMRHLAQLDNYSAWQQDL